MADPILKPFRGFVAPVGQDASPCRQEAALKQEHQGYVHLKI